MGAEIVKVYKQEVPALRFIGKKYGDEDRVDGMFGKHWDDWFQNGWFGVLESQTDKDMKSIYEDGDATIGLMRCSNSEPFEYWIGKFMPVGTNVPEGFDCRDFPEASLCICWLYGNWENLFVQEDRCAKKLEEEGYQTKNVNDAFWFFERYSTARFGTPDEKGNFILDIAHFVQ